MRTVRWPAAGDATAYRRRLAVLSMVVAPLIVTPLVLAWTIEPVLLRTIVPLALALLLVGGMWCHAAAREVARRSEVVRSFAGLRVIHHGQSFSVAAPSPLLGVYATRDDAARAATQRGSWAVVVHAWDRYFLLAADPVQRGGGSPVAFRSNAVADVVPAVQVDAASA